MSSAIKTRNRVFDFDAFCALVHENDKADLVDGVIYMASPENLEHYRAEQWLMRLLGDYLELRQILGEVFGTKIAFRLNDKNAPEPDVAYVCNERAHIVKSGFIDGPPDWAVEIVSPSSIDRDYIQKRRQYQKAGVREYWIIDLLKEKMTCYRLQENGKYQEIRPRGGMVKSSVIPGFWARPAWFWQTPLPSRRDALKEILATANGK